MNQHPQVLDHGLAMGPIDWRSPLVSDERAEYRDQAALDRLGIRPTRRRLADFWPRGGPQWDALARAASGEVILLEAKAHIAEMFSGSTQASPESQALIERSLQETAAALGAEPGSDWTRRFYQYANRLAHAYFLNVVNEIPTKLVFVYFIGDAEMNGPDDRSQWEAAIEVLHGALGIRSKLPDYVLDLYIDVRLSVPVVA